MSSTEKKLPSEIQMAIQVRKNQLYKLNDEMELLKIEEEEITDKERAIREEISQLTPEQKQARSEVENHKSEIQRLQELNTLRREALQNFVKEFEEKTGKSLQNVPQQIEKIQYEIDHGNNSPDQEEKMKRQVSNLKEAELQLDDYKSAVVQLRYIKKLDIMLKSDYGSLIKAQKQDKTMSQVIQKNNEIFAALKQYQAENDKRYERIKEIQKLKKELKEQINQMGK